MQSGENHTTPVQGFMPMFVEFLSTFWFKPKLAQFKQVQLSCFPKKSVVISYAQNWHWVSFEKEIANINWIAYKNSILAQYKYLAHLMRLPFLS